MAKRFVDTGIWAKPWFRKLSPKLKVAWYYVLANCDNVGVWDGDVELANFSIGEPVDWEQLLGECNGNIERLPNGKWWVVDFCRFQQGDLFSRKQSNILTGCIKLLEKHDLLARVREQFAKSSPTVGEGLAKGSPTVGQGLANSTRTRTRSRTRTRNRTRTRSAGQETEGAPEEAVSKEEGLRLIREAKEKLEGKRPGSPRPGSKEQQ